METSATPAPTPTIDDREGTLNNNDASASREPPNYSDICAALYQAGEACRQAAAYLADTLSAILEIEDELGEPAAELIADKVLRSAAGTFQMQSTELDDAYVKLSRFNSYLDSV
jgi:hypothetical protein